ncbi:MAG: tRNA pseudouridine(55) synthase TruB [Candidatus Izimaplasma sp.]|nr:tRNA pseudouridine(55) synthase TruB [Candidatus Izimaplasma bacterium]
MKNTENGIIIIDKPKGMTSHDVVDVARKALDTRRIGHIGTLDPNATGVLVLCVNKATKLVKYFSENTKKYTAEIVIGKSTDSDDCTGKVVHQKDASNIKKKDVLEKLKVFEGKTMQTPPKFSAIKVNGFKLYELARRDIQINNIEPREVEIFSIDNFEELETGEEYRFKADFKVSKGTYIRSIARDLGNKLDNFGCLGELRRTRIENFHIEDAHSIDDLKENKIKVEEPFQYLDMQKLIVDERAKSYIENGRFLELDLFKKKTDTIIYSNEGQVLAIYYYDEEKDVMRMSVKWC